MVVFNSLLDGKPAQLLKRFGVFCFYERRMSLPADFCTCWSGLNLRPLSQHWDYNNQRRVANKQTNDDQTVFLMVIKHCSLFLPSFYSFV